MTETQNWLDTELDELTKIQVGFTGEKLPPLKLETGKITKFSIDFTLPFGSYTSEDGTIKKIIPVLHKGDRKVLWLNVRNPLYRQLLEQGKNGKKDFAVSTTGSLKDTRYTIVEEE
jgi:hypothetical protein